MTRLRRARRFIASALNIGCTVVMLAMVLLERQVAEIDDGERRGE